MARSARKTVVCQPRHCVPCEGDIQPMRNNEVRSALAKVAGWTVEDGKLSRVFEFTDFHQTMAFVNAVAWLANLENHHPDMEVGYSRCKVCYYTHSIGGLSQNDFICAGKINAMLNL